MTAIAGYDSRPPAAGARRSLPAGSHARRSMLALAAVESGRLLRHPAVLAATALSAWTMWQSGRGAAPVLHYADIATQYAVAPLAAAALLATNLAVLRPHRDGAADLYAATRLTQARRTQAHLLSVLPVVALGGVLVVADLAWLTGMPGSTGAPHVAEAATGPVLIALGGCLGVLLGRVARSVAVAPLVLVALASGSVTLAELHVGGRDQRSWTWLAALLRPVTDDPPPAALLGRPASWHLIYLLGIAIAVAALAALLSQARERVGRRAQVAAAIVLAAGLAATTTAAVAQTRPTSPALTARRLAAIDNPAAELVCQPRGPAIYCVFPGFEPQINLWEPIVGAVVAAVPPDAAARALPVTVAQRVGFHRLVDEQFLPDNAAPDPPVAPTGDEQLPSNAAPGPPVAPVGTVWGRDGREHVIAQARLAANVAARLIASPHAGGGPEFSSCGAQAVVALWLAGQASPHVVEGIREAVADSPFETFAFPHDTDIYDPWFAVRAAQFALALLDRPRDQVASALWHEWDLMTAPATTLDRLGEVVGVRPPPDSSNPSGNGDPDC